MKAVVALDVLARLSADQWGMVTSAQASQVGVTRLDLSRLCRSGHLIRLGHGVYKDAGAGDDDLEELRAVWLSTQPAVLAADRLASPDVVVAASSAAWVHQLGDLEPRPYVFGSAQRRQTQRDELRYVRREYGSADITIVRGLPVTTVERTIADLLRDRVDRSLVADVLSDAVMAGGVDRTRLAELVGEPTVDELLTAAGLDADALAAQIARSPMADVMARSIYGDAVRDVMESVNKALRPALLAVDGSYGRALRAVRAALPQLPADVVEATHHAADAISASVEHQVMTDTQKKLQALTHAASGSDVLSARFAESYRSAVRLGHLHSEARGGGGEATAPARDTKTSEVPDDA